VLRKAPGAPVTQITPPVETKSDAQASAGSNLDKFMESQVSKRFTGSPVTLQVRETPLADVLTMIGEASGFNIILGEGVGGKVTLSLVDVPWDQALDVVLTTKRLGAERKNNVLRITTLANLTAEKEELLRAKLASERSAPRSTRVFPINYADIRELQSVLSAFSASNASILGAGAIAGAAPGGGAGGVGVASASIQVDQRTNSLIVQDTFENLEKIRKLIELMDTQTPQVLIEAKVVEASDDFNKTISGQLGFSRINGEGRGNAASFNSAPASTGLTGAAVQTPQPRGGSIGYSPSIAFLPPAIDRLNLLISMLEREEQVKVISSPKTVVLNKKTAKIVKGTPTTIQETVPSPTGNLVTQRIVQANLSLEATPTVTNIGSVLMNLKISRDTVLNNLVAPRNIETEVLVDSGSTLVIGGIYSSEETKRKNGFPFLKDLPLVGWLFGGSENTNNRSELFIFVTPRILNAQEPELISRPTPAGESLPSESSPGPSLELEQG
jgi:type IV pilus assembly protein PilQ